MKKLLLASLAVLMGAGIAVANEIETRNLAPVDDAEYNNDFETNRHRRRSSVYIDYTYRDGYWYPRRRYYDRDRIVFSTRCAPDTVADNLDRTETALFDLVSREEFVGAEKFKERINVISRINNNEERAAAYISMVGINPSDDAEVAMFIGAREPKVSWLKSLEHNAGLSRTQAEIVAASLAQSLRGGLR